MNELPKLQGLSYEEKNGLVREPLLIALLRKSPTVYQAFLNKIWIFRGAHKKAVAKVEIFRHWTAKRVSPESRYKRASQAKKPVC